MSFKRILGKLAEKELKKKAKLLRHQPMFSGWNAASLKTLSLYLKPRRYFRNQVVYHEGEPSEEIFIVETGEFAFTQTIELEQKSETPWMMQYVNKH
jgi:CRP-like cAMP-binding protein